MSTTRPQKVPSDPCHDEESDGREVPKDVRLRFQRRVETGERPGDRRLVESPRVSGV